MKLIGISGHMGSGKSTLVSCLTEVQITPVSNIKLAQPLYDIQEMIYYRIESVYRRPDSFIKDRKLLQFLGTEFGRSIRDTLWIDLWKEEVRHAVEYAKNQSKDLLITCDDVRFDNEAHTIKDMGGIIIKLVSDRVDTNVGFSKHKSEEGIDNKYIDCIIENNGTIEDLKESLYTLNRTIDLW